MRPLLFHLADNTMVEGMKAFFQRDDWHHTIGCSRFEIDPVGEADFFKVPGGNDQVVWKNSGENLRPFTETHDKLLVIVDQWFDPWPEADQIRCDIEQDLMAEGWERGRFEVIVIQPMLEAWLWMDSDHVARAFGLNRYADLRRRLVDEGMWEEGQAKPLADKLKDARNRAAKLGRTRSGRILFRKVFRAVSNRALRRCDEPGFQAMRAALQTWFPPEGGAA